MRSGAPLATLLAAALLAGGLLVGGVSEAGQDGFSAARKKLQATLVKELKALAEYASSGNLFRCRNEVYEIILRFDPDHALARKWLKYKRNKDGTWVRQGKYKPPRNFKTPGEAWERKQHAVGDRYADALLGLLQTHAEGLPASLRAQALREAALVASHRADIRTANGEVESPEGAWLLAETLSARTRRPALLAEGERAVAAVPEPRIARPTRAENAARLGWTAILQGRLVRVLGTVEEGELYEAVKRAEATAPVFKAAFAVKPPRLNGLGIFVLGSKDDRTTLLAKHPSSNEEFAKRAGRLASAWLPKTNLIYGYSDSREQRLEWCSRQPVGALLRWKFGIQSKRGWAFEGFGLYLSHLIAGRRGTFFVRRTKYGEKAEREGDLWDKLRDTGTDWRAEGRILLAGDKAPDLRLLLGKDVNSMNTEDMLYAYLLAAYCLEGRPKETPALLTAIGKEKKDPDAAFKSVFAIDIDGLDARVRRWLEETK